MRLIRDQVLAGALDLLDETGIDNLTMRRLAAALGVQNGATYWHFPSKQVLLEAMAEVMRKAFRTGAPRYGLLSRRDGARIFSGAFIPMPSALAYGETMIGLPRGAGMNGREASWAVDTITYYVVGHVIEEQTAAGLPDEGTEAGARLNKALGPDRHPNLLAAIGDIPAPHPGEHFTYGLEVIVAGLRSVTP
jgi:TetR/AcrR family tetracycline transcriptional repressor